MPETLLSPSNILLYGREVADLTITKGPHIATSAGDLGDNKFIQRQLEKDQDNAKERARFARIYGFSYEGHYYDLPTPALFLVHGEGKQAEDIPEADYVARGPGSADKTGVGAQGYSLSSDMRVWAYDKADFSMRLDVETGPFEQILLEAALRAENTQTYYSGAKVSGAKVSGAKLSLRGGADD